MKPSPLHYPAKRKELYAIVVACITWANTGMQASALPLQQPSSHQNMGLWVISLGRSHETSAFSLLYCCKVKLSHSYQTYSRYHCRLSFTFADGEIQRTGPTSSSHSDSHPCRSDVHLTTRLHNLQNLGIVPSMRKTYSSGVRVS